MNIEKDLIKKLEEIGFGSISFKDKNAWDDVDESKADYLHIGLDKRPDAKTVWILKSILIPKKKPFTVEYVMDKLSKEKTYINFSKDFNKLLKIKFPNDNMCVYPTTYGIGVFNIYNMNKNKQMDKIEALLKEYDIEYSTEYSDARWVYRYKLSKSTENINKMKNL